MRGEISEDFELRTSQLLAIWRDILSHYQSRPDIQQQLKNEFIKTIERAITPPPWAPLSGVRSHRPRS